MISLKLIIYVSIGTIAMLIPIILQMKWMGIRLWKSVPTALALTVCGTIGTYIWFFIENHWIGGTSFYGAVFIVPAAFVGVAKLLQIPYGKLMDICAPAECAMLVIMKIQCLISGCCRGIALFITEAGEKIYFPSQIVELVNALGILILLLFLSRKEKNFGLIYPMYMLIYGISRFVLNSFRETSPFVWILPAGHFWSLCAIAIGGLVLMTFDRKRKKKEMTTQNEF